MGRWSFVLTDYAFNPVAELTNVGDRQIVLALNSLPTLSFTMNVRNRLTPNVLNMSAYVKAYRTDLSNVKHLEFFGPIVSAEEQISQDTKTVAVNAVGVGWFLSKRLSGQSAVGTAFTNTDRAMVVKALIDTANTQSLATYDGAGVPTYTTVGETNISTSDIVSDPSPYVPPGGSTAITTGNATQGTSVTGRATSGSGITNISAASAVNYTAGPYKPILDVISELSTGVDGFDWQIVPFDNFSGGVVSSSKIGQFRAYPIIGQRRVDAVFEYGDGRSNVQDYTRTVSRDTQANRVFHIASAGPDAVGFPTVLGTDNNSMPIWRVMEDLASADLEDLGLRKALVNEHVRVRAYPRQVATFTPALSDPEHVNRVPQYRDAWAVGDQVRARIVTNGALIFDAWMRIYGVTFVIDSNGMERPSLTLVQE